MTMQTQFPKVELPQIPQRVYRIEEYGAVTVSYTHLSADESSFSAGRRCGVEECIWTGRAGPDLSEFQRPMAQGAAREATADSAIVSCDVSDDPARRRFAANEDG